MALDRESSKLVLLDDSRQQSQLMVFDLLAEEKDSLHTTFRTNQVLEGW